MSSSVFFDFETRRWIRSAYPLSSFPAIQIPPFADGGKTLFLRLGSTLVANPSSFPSSRNTVDSSSLARSRPLPPSPRSVKALVSLYFPLTFETGEVDSILLRLQLEKLSLAELVEELKRR